MVRRTVLSGRLDSGIESGNPGPFPTCGTALVPLLLFHRSHARRVSAGGETYRGSGGQPRSHSSKWGGGGDVPGKAGRPERAPKGRTASRRVESQQARTAPSAAPTARRAAWAR